MAIDVASAIGVAKWVRAPISVVAAAKSDFVRGSEWRINASGRWLINAPICLCRRWMHRREVEAWRQVDGWIACHQEDPSVRYELD